MTPQLLPLWIMPGANRAIHLGAHIHRAWSTPIRHPNTVVEKHGDIEFVNMLPLTTRLAKEMGMGVDVE